MAPRPSVDLHSHHLCILQKLSGVNMPNMCSRTLFCLQSLYQNITFSPNACVATRLHACDIVVIADATTDEGEAPEDAASRWREGVLEDAGVSSSFAGVFNLDTRPRQISAPPIAAARQRWSPAAAQVLSV